MTPDELRAELRLLQDRHNDLCREMDAEADANNGAIPHERAVAFQDQLEAISARTWELKGLLRTPAPT